MSGRPGRLPRAFSASAESGGKRGAASAFSASAESGGKRGAASAFSADDESPLGECSGIDIYAGGAKIQSNMGDTGTGS